MYMINLEELELDMQDLRMLIISISKEIASLSFDALRIQNLEYEKKKLLETYQKDKKRFLEILKDRHTEYFITLNKGRRGND